jgi:hypothetical protein
MKGSSSLLARAAALAWVCTFVLPADAVVHPVPFTTQMTKILFQFKNVVGTITNQVFTQGSTATFSWGTPAGVAQNPLQKQSSFQITGVTVPLNINAGDIFVMGNFQHNNMVISGSQDFTVDLVTNATFAYQAEQVSFKVNLRLIETINYPAHAGCVEGGVKPCPDKVVFNNNQPMTTTSVTPGGVTVQLTVLGFRQGGTISPTFSFLTNETKYTNVELVAKLEATGEDTGGGKDPHFFTWKKERFDFHGECDLVFLENPDFHHGLGMDIHMRTKLRRNWSFVERLAVRIGSDILEVQGGVDESLYWINGKQGPALPETIGIGVPPVELAATLGGFPMNYKRANAKQRVFKVFLDHDQIIEVRTYKDFVTVDIHNGSEEDFVNSRGLSGNYLTGHKLARDFTTVIEDPIQFGMEWQRRPDEPFLFSTMDNAPVQYPTQCILPSEFEDTQRRRRLGESTAKQAAAEKACAHVQDPEERDDCIFDVLLTDDMEMAGAY